MERVEEVEGTLGDMVRELIRKQREAAGQYPEGKLSPDDAGAMMIVVTAVRDTVVIGFAEPAEWIGLPPDLAVALAHKLIEHAGRAERATDG